VGTTGATLEGAGRSAAALFGEAQSLAVVTCAAADEDLLVEMAEKHDVPLRGIGLVGGAHLRSETLDIPVDELRAAYESGLPLALEGATANV
jgi:hypothetical protein